MKRRRIAAVMLIGTVLLALGATAFVGGLSRVVEANVFGENDWILPLLPGEDPFSEEPPRESSLSEEELAAERAEILEERASILEARAGQEAEGSMGLVYVLLGMLMLGSGLVAILWGVVSLIRSKRPTDPALGSD